MVFLDPNKVLDQIPLRNDMIAAEFGAGAGGFTIPLAKRLQGGRVYAFDVQAEPLSALKSKAETEHLVNIEARIADLEQAEATRLKENTIDLVVIVNTLFQVQNKEQFIKEAARVLKTGAMLLVVEWLPNAALGPKQGRIGQQSLKQLAQQFKLQVAGEFEFGKYHYGVLFIK